MQSVYLLWHTRKDGDNEDDKLLGVFSSHHRAQAAQEYALTQKGFKQYPDGFCIVCYELDKQEWLEGFGE